MVQARGVWHGFRGLNFAHPRTGKIVGLEVELLEALGRDLGVRIEMVDAAGQSVFGAIDQRVTKAETPIDR